MELTLQSRLQQALDCSSGSAAECRPSAKTEIAVSIPPCPLPAGWDNNAATVQLFIVAEPVQGTSQGFLNCSNGSMTRAAAVPPVSPAVTENAMSVPLRSLLPARMSAGSPCQRAAVHWLQQRTSVLGAPKLVRT